MIVVASQNAKKLKNDFFQKISLLLHLLKNDKKLTRVAKKTKRSWTYMKESGADSPYLFLHSGFSIVASLGHP